MGKVMNSGRRYLLCFITGLAAGILIGTAALSLLVSYRIDSYHQQIRNLEASISDRDIRLEKLEQTVNNRKFVLKATKINFTNKLDEIDRLEIEKFIREQYSRFVGNEVKSIDVESLYDILDNRIINVENKEYKLRISKLMLSDILHIWLKAELRD